MLSDVERKAINQLKADTSFYDYELKNGNYIYELFKIEVYKKDIDVILNLIKKQSKEIEELKGNDLRKDELVANMSTRHFHDREKIRKYEELQDKIKAKIEEVDKDENASIPDFIEYAKEYATQKLQSLLEKE